MIIKRIEIWEKGTYKGEGEDGFQPYMDTYLLAGTKVRGAVLICPGGGYTHTSTREAEPVALQFNAAGFHAFVLYYSVAPRKHPQPLMDLTKAMCIIRSNATEWMVNPGKIAVCGFSAGGHLAASLGVHWDKPYLLEVPGMEQGMNRPNALILSYPAITSGQYAHRGSFKNLLGDNPDGSLLHEMSLEHHVSEKTPPTFIWHTFDDKSVPLENTLLFANALRNNHVHFEMHVFPYGSHGLSLVTEETGTNPEQVFARNAVWMGLCIEWLKCEFK